MKTAVVARAYYEVPYMDFFIKYYLALGFDKVVILQSDTLDYNTAAAVDGGDAIYPADKVLFKSVKNTGDCIIMENVEYYTDATHDWILGIDIDEFLIIDVEKYQNINQYMESQVAKFPDVKQFMYRWICIDKMTVWDKSPLITDYINGSLKFNASKYIKTIFKTGINNPFINCHYLAIKTKYKALNYVPTILDGNSVGRSYNSYVDKFNTPETNLCDGFILHLHTRSLTNGLLKSLVTRLLHKKIKDSSALHKLIKQEIPNTPDTLNATRKRLYNIMGLKAALPKENEEYGKRVNHHINWEFVIRMLNNSFNLLNLQNTPVYNLDTEWTLLKSACEQRKMDFDKLKTLLYALNQSTFIL